ncbi:MAG: M50 family metallopeptidase [Ruminococcus flavefaciens]|nr:M50 family metallopeptidase [Ruminococcus flavefaciens]MCM1231385.1 M50 family metallopeptidase [Ruminococcus flavefaciens]
MIKIRVKFSFLLFNALLFMFRDTEIISAFYIACILHEAGHITALKLLGGELKSIVLSWSGIKMSASPCSSLKEGIFVLLSGPAVNIVLYIVLTACGIKGFLPLFNLAEGLFNLLPYSMLDGGAVLNLIAEGSVYESQLNKFWFILRLIVSTIIAIFMLNVYFL